MAKIAGSVGDDELYGTGLSDEIDGLEGNDNIYSGAGGDRIIFSLGQDFVDGGDDEDILDFESNASAVTIDSSLGIARDGAGNETNFVNIEDFYGTPYNDVMQGRETNSLFGVELNALNGDTRNYEYFKGNAGNDFIDGRGGYDEIVFTSSLTGLTIDLASTKLEDGLGGTDTVLNIEGVEGTDFDDFIYGNNTDNCLDGRNGNDTIDGRGGFDFAEYNGARRYNLKVDLTAGTATYSKKPNETFYKDKLYNIEGVIGSDNDDLLVGDGVDNKLYGALGDDSLTGADGNDIIDGGPGIDTAIFSELRANYSITDLGGILIIKDLIGNKGTDKLISIEKLQFKDVTLDVYELVFDEVPNEEGAVQENTDGVDLFIGTPGLIDTVVYQNVRVDSEVSVHDGVIRVTNGARTDELTDIERISFIDTSIALDIDGNAGSTAKILGAVFGKAALANKAYAGIGLSLLDSGEYTYESLMDYALTVAGAQSNEQVVELLYTNAVGVVPTTQQVQAFVALLDDGTYTRASLGALAAEYAVSSITLAGLAETGLEYTPFG